MSQDWDTPQRLGGVPASGSIERGSSVVLIEYASDFLSEGHAMTFPVLIVQFQVILETKRRLTRHTRLAFSIIRNRRPPHRNRARL